MLELLPLLAVQTALPIIRQMHDENQSRLSETQELIRKAQREQYLHDDVFFIIIVKRGSRDDR